MNFSIHHFIVFAFILASIGNLQAKETNLIKGQLQDTNGQAIPYANVSLIEPESHKLIAGAVSENNGSFLIRTKETGNFKLKVSMIGFESYESEIFVIREGADRDFGTISLSEETAELGEVTVKSSRPEIIIEADKTIVNVAGTVMAEGSTALDVIGRSPGVYVDGDGNINLNGRSGIIVLIDDRQTYMSAADLANFLRAMPAENIQSIEVINNPPARFDAEGSAGVLNIRLKKNNQNGVNGNIQFGHQYNSLHAPFAGATVNVKQGKWTSNASINYNEFARPMELELLRRFQLEEGISEFDQEANINIRRKNLFFNGGTDYEINERNSVGITVQASNSKGTEDGVSLTTISNPQNTNLNFLEALNDSESENQRFFTNLHYVGKLDTIGTRLTSDIDFTIMESGSLGLLGNTYWLNDSDNLRSDRIRTDNSMYYTIFTSKVDFIRSMKKGKTMEAGVKGSWVKSDNDLDIQRGESGEQLQPDPSSNRFIYHENVLAGYMNIKGKFSPNLEYQAGLRGEYSDISGNSVTLNQINTQRYFNLFPSMYLQHKVNDNYQIVYNVNRRITRPNYRLLNPFVFYIDPLTTERGNPNLVPQYSNNFEMNHIVKGNYQFTLSYSRTFNSFNQIMTQNEVTRESTLQVQNLDQADNLSFRTMIPVELTKWWSTNNMVQVYYNRFQSPIGDQLLDMEQVSGIFRSQHTLNLPKGFKMEVTGMYLSPFLEGQARIKGVGWVDAGLTKSFKDDKISLTVNATDVLRTQVFRVNVNFDQIDTRIQQYNNNQAVRFTLRYRFNYGEKFRVDQRSGSKEEQDRLNN